MEKRETVGKLSIDLLAKADDKHTAGEQMSEQLSEYDKNLYECFDNNKHKYTGIFYIVVVTRGDRLLKNVIRHQFFSRNSCPTPEYDQAVYQCHKDWLEPRFMWVIPCMEYAEHLKNNVPLVPLEEAELLRFVLDFYDGTLLKLVKKLNNETDGIGQLILGEPRGK